MNQEDLGNKKNILLIIIIIAIAVIAWLYVSISDKDSKSDQPIDDSSTSTTTSDSIPEDSTELFNLMEDGVLEEVSTVTITYTDRGFSLEQIEIPVGTAITFVNESRDPMWVASDNHPTHKIYPGSNIKKCDSDKKSEIFDQCEGGNNYTFTFNELGTWDYHNHLRPGDGGTVVVK
tara:strand:+ start:647 stop:1174 length:528 start_codon:yes stop_codon:yes gene_type:complete